MNSDDGLLMKYFEYFVLKPKGDDIHAAASRAAMAAYAHVIKVDNPKLSNELLAWVDNTTPKHG